MNQELQIADPLSARLAENQLGSSYALLLGLAHYGALEADRGPSFIPLHNQQRLDRKKELVRDATGYNPLMEGLVGRSRSDGSSLEESIEALVNEAKRPRVGHGDAAEQLVASMTTELLAIDTNPSFAVEQAGNVIKTLSHVWCRSVPYIHSPQQSPAPQNEFSGKEATC